MCKKFLFIFIHASGPKYPLRFETSDCSALEEHFRVLQLEQRFLLRIL